MGPRRVMMLGVAIWIVCQVLFLTLAIPTRNYDLMLLFHGLRGFGYPLFVFGFLVWIVLTVSPARLGAACGWFWFAFTGGLPTLGSVFARVSIPIVGAYVTLWMALATVCIGALVVLFGIRDDRGSTVEHKPGYSPLKTLFSSLSIVRDHPKVGLGSIVRAISNRFRVRPPGHAADLFHEDAAFHVGAVARGHRVHLHQQHHRQPAVGHRQRLAELASDDHVHRRRRLGDQHDPALRDADPSRSRRHAAQDVRRRFYGVTLAGYVPLSALMPYLAPENKPAAMSMLNLGAGMSVWIGPAIVAVFLSTVGVFGVMCIYSGTCLISAVIAHFLTLAPEVQAEVDADRAAGRVVAGH